MIAVPLFCTMPCYSEILVHLKLIIWSILTVFVVQELHNIFHAVMLHRTTYFNVLSVYRQTNILKAHRCGVFFISFLCNISSFKCKIFLISLKLHTDNSENLVWNPFRAYSRGCCTVRLFSECPPLINCGCDREPVLRIQEILGGSMPLTNGSGFGSGFSRTLR
jgi:hypothetical protein